MKKKDMKQKRILVVKTDSDELEKELNRLANKGYRILTTVTTIFYGGRAGKHRAEALVLELQEEWIESEFRPES